MELYGQDMRKQSLNGTEDQLKRRDGFNVIVPEFSIQLRPSRSALESGSKPMGSGHATSHDLPSTHLAASNQGCFCCRARRQLVAQ